MEVDEEVYLAHYGVKGMRWGVRKGRGGNSTLKEPKKPLTAEEKRARARKIRRISTGVRLGVVSAVVVTSFIADRQNVKAAQLKSSKEAVGFVKKLTEQEKNTIYKNAKGINSFIQKSDANQISRNAADIKKFLGNS